MTILATDLISAHLPAGPQGIQGRQGIQGTAIQGTTGSQGIQGIQGTAIQGTIGSQGIQGVSGSSTTINAVDNTTDTSLFPVMVTAAGSNEIPAASTTKLYFNALTGDLSATNFNSLSDMKFKENFNPEIDSFAILNKIQTYEFDWKDNGVKSYGVIAQEIEKIMPELVKTNSAGMKTVAYTPLIAILIDAVKKLMKEHEK